MTKPPALRMHLENTYIRRRHCFEDPSTVFEIIDSDEDDVACVESSHPQSAGQHFNQVNYKDINLTDAVISSTTTMDSTIPTPSIVNVAIGPEPTTEMSAALTTASSSTSSPSIVKYVIVRRRSQQIFTAEQERELSRFVREASDFYNGMTSKDVRILAYVYGVCNQVNFPVSWCIKHEASFAWCSGFAKRHKLRLVNMFSNTVNRTEVWVW